MPDECESLKESNYGETEMTKQTSDVVGAIVREKLSDYVEMGEQTRGAEVAKAKTPRAKTKSAPVSPRRVTSYADYAKRVPAVQTPHVFRQAEVDRVLLDCRELPTPDKPIKDYAGYSRAEWDKLLGVLASYMADVCEGAGLHYKGSFAVGSFRKGLSVLLQQHFMHHDPYDKRNRFISVDGRIDSDERKP